MNADTSKDKRDMEDNWKMVVKTIVHMDMVMGSILDPNLRHQAQPSDWKCHSSKQARELFQRGRQMDMTGMGRRSREREDLWKSAGGGG